MFEDVGYDDVIVWTLGFGLCAFGVGALLWGSRLAGARAEWEAAHPYPEVEKPKVPRHFRFVGVDELEPEQLDEVDERFAQEFGRPRAGENDPQVGDVVATHIVYARAEGRELVQAPVMARVLWPRETYVRALMLPGRTRVLDIPRSAVAGTACLVPS